MQNSVRGSEEDVLLTREEAAEWLSLPKKALTKLIGQGLLKPAKKNGTKSWFLASEVSRLSKTISRDITLPTVAGHALQALASAQRAEKHLEELLFLFGVKYEPLSVEPEDIEALYMACSRLLELPTETLTSAQVRDWAALLNRVNRGYMLLVSLLTGSKEPWGLILGAADRLLEQAPRHRFPYDPELALAYGLLETARRSVRQEAYFYCRDQYSPSSANRTFPEVTGREVNSTILSLIQE